ncbi:hypothetical protein AVEN_202941-1 [Araneus ventricosus]|uniref:Uncharacterized protein n=1 Tax=Araneus ventricosus TaxID=182803 RepID=A0A4Y2J4M9_ARAVE|nr:hypothetical protein AVEN_202941-1 [Araneus ventricosus]
MYSQRKKSQGVKSGDLGEQSEVILTNTPNPAMRKFIVQVSTNTNVPMRGCPVLLEDKIPGIISQLRKQPQRIHCALMIIDKRRYKMCGTSTITAWTCAM